MFHKCKDVQEIKNLYKKLALRLHPDQGGESFYMILLTECYEMALEFKKTKTNDSTIKNTYKKYENSYEDVDFGDDRLKIIKEIYLYAENHKKFSRSYVDSLSEFLEEKGFLTSNQFNKLVKIYYSFRMDKENIHD